MFIFLKKIYSNFINNNPSLSNKTPQILFFYKCTETESVKNIILKKGNLKAFPLKKYLLHYSWLSVLLRKPSRQKWRLLTYNINTDRPSLRCTSILRTVCFVPGKESSYIFSKFNLLNTDTPLIPTFSMAPSVPIYKFNGVWLY